MFERLVALLSFEAARSNDTVRATPTRSGPAVYVGLLQPYDAKLAGTVYEGCFGSFLSEPLKPVAPVD